MILRRVIEHLSDQNWTAVAVDFVIVVVGVFIGIQVSNWNEARAESAIGQFYLERVAEDIEDDALTLEIKVNRWLFNAGRIVMFERYLTEGTTSGFSEWELYSQMFLQAGWSSFAPNRITYDELVSTGQFRLVRGSDIRRAIGDYYQALEQSKAFYSLDTPTRTLVRQAYSAEAQAYLWNVCFSIERYRAKAGGGVGCPPGVSDEEVSRTLALLRETDGVIGAFRFANSVLLYAAKTGAADVANAQALAATLREAAAR